MNSITLPWREFICLNEQCQGIVFLNLGDGSIPHFILDLVLELEREKIISNLSICEIFERSYLIDKDCGNQRDLALMLKNTEIDAFERLRHWISLQGTHTVILLIDYVVGCET